MLLAAVVRAEPPPWCGTVARHDLTPVHGPPGLFELAPKRQVSVDVNDRHARTALVDALASSGCAQPGVFRATVVVDRAGAVLAVSGDACIASELRRVRFDTADDVRTLVVRIAI